MNRRLSPLLALMLLPTTPAAAIDADALIARLARPAPASIAFTEVRVSPLLREPLVVSGELEFSGPASLDRHVRKPYREDTAIRGESVRVEREGEAPRSFALKRAPCSAATSAERSVEALSTTTTAPVRPERSIPSRAWSTTPTPSVRRSKRAL